MHVAEVLRRDPSLAGKGRKILDDPDQPFPILSAKIKLTWRCNLKCGLCSLWKKPSRGGAARDLPVETVKQTLHELRQRGLVKIHFSGGEVLLLDTFPEIAAYARELGLQVNLTSNGTLLDKDMARFMTEHRIHAINISIDSADEKQHDKMRAKKGAWRNAWRGIDNLIERRKRKGRGPTVAVNTIITRRTLPHLDALYEMLIEHGVDRWRLLPVDTDRRALRPTAEEWRELAVKWEKWKQMLTRLPVDWSSDRSAAKAAKGMYAGRFYHDQVCFAPWFNLFVDADGKTYPCCMGKTHIPPYGDITRSSLDELLASSARREVLCSMAAGEVFPVCNYCDDFLEENLAFMNLYPKEGSK